MSDMVNIRAEGNVIELKAPPQKQYLCQDFQGDRLRRLVLGRDCSGSPVLCLKPRVGKSHTLMSMSLWRSQHHSNCVVAALRTFRQTDITAVHALEVLHLLALDLDLAHRDRDNDSYGQQLNGQPPSDGVCAP